MRLPFPTPTRPSPKLAFIAVFFTLASLPGLEALTHVIKVRPIQENRTLAPAVGPTTPWASAPKVWDRWYGDHFGFRPWLIQLKTQIDYSLFGFSDRVLIGRDGQLFYRETTNLGEPAMDRHLAANGQAALEGIARFCDALRDSGVRCAFLIPMMSDRYYPELLPATAVHRPAKSRIDDFIAKLRAIPSVLYIDSDAIVRRTLAVRRVFHKTDFHWNDPAAFEVAKALVDAIAREQGLPASPWTHELEIETQTISGGIAMFMPLFVRPEESALMVKRDWSNPEGFVENDKAPPFEYVITAAPNPRLLPPTVVFGDSFFDGMQRSGLTAEFVELRRLRWNAVKVSDVAADLPADTRWLVIEFIEVSQQAITAFADRRDIDAAITLIRARRGPAPR